MARWVVLAAIAWSVWGCGDGARQEPDAPFDAQQAVADFAGVTYRRSGGIAGAEDRISIASDGSIETSGRFLGTRRGRISEFQIMQLVRLLEGWEKLREQYPAPSGTADAFEHEIEYRGKRVQASDASREMPEQFRRVKDRLEGLTRGLKPAE
jgi:hypothetical protein